MNPNSHPAWDGLHGTLPRSITAGRRWFDGSKSSSGMSGMLSRVPLMQRQGLRPCHPNSNSWSSMLWLLIGYMYLFIHRPFEIWPSVGVFRIELVYMLITGSIWLVNSGKRWLPNRLHWANFIFAGVVVLTWLASSWSDAGQLTVE